MSERRMARLGLIGGTSWESTLEYYRRLNEATNHRLGGLSTVEIILWSLDFGVVWDCKERGDFAALQRMFDEAARHLAAGGAELIVICSNSGHQRADTVEAASGLPLVHIVDAVGQEIERLGAGRVGLLGTLDTMRGSYYGDRLKQRFGIDVIVPPPPEQERVHAIAIEEVARGVRLERSRAELGRIVDGLAARGAEAVILGCTELPLVAPEQARLPLVDTVAVHVEAIIEAAVAIKRTGAPASTRPVSAARHA
jgi:aspartate racemase